jgi:GTPase
VKNAEGGQIVYLDTPGIHKPLHRMNRRMLDVARDAMREVDVVGLVVDVSEASGGGDRFALDLVQRADHPVVLVLNKIDLVARQKLLPIIDEWSKRHAFADIVPASAVTGENCDRLEQVLLSHLPDGEPLYPADYLTDQPERFFVAEIVREQVLRHTHAELPYTSAVTVDRFEEPDERGLMRLYCTILVERDSQKPIVIGRGGEMIKRIGTGAREELERFFDTKVFLDLHVKVQSDWREDERVLNRLLEPPRE